MAWPDRSLSKIDRPNGAAGRSERLSTFSAAPEPCQEVEHLEIQPDDRGEQAQADPLLAESS